MQSYVSGKLQVGLIVLVATALSSCGDKGHDANGPIKGYLILRRPDGNRAEFYLGGFHANSECVNTLLNEVQASEDDRSNLFWTNADFSYGGYKQPGWEQNVVLGVRCELE